MTANRTTYAALFLITLATLMFEVLLTRIFSVTTWYHCAFLVISLAMLGMTGGAIRVYLIREKVTDENLYTYLSGSALAFAVLSVVAVLLHISTPMLIPLDARMVMTSSLVLALPPLLLAFVASGMCVSLCLTRFPSQLPRLYACDLLGAASGCIAMVLSLKVLDGISDLLFIAFISSVAALLFSWPKAARLRTLSLVACCVFAGVTAVNGYTAYEQHPLIRLNWAKGERSADVRYEKWNCFSRIRVMGDPDKEQELREFGVSHSYPGKTEKYLYLDMDGYAATYLYDLRDGWKNVDLLAHDLGEIVYQLRSNANVLIIGVGGGRDVNSALLSNQKSVTGVEINDNIISMLTKVYADYTGHLERNPKVTLVNDEARSYITRAAGKYDIIQATLVDTWAASSSGAYSMTENSLYTVDAWTIFLDHLSDHGILAMSRWYGKHVPAEIYRLVVLASDALKRTGVADPSTHIVLMRLMNNNPNQPDGLGTILVGKSAFTNEELDKIEKICATEGFEIMYSPRSAKDPNLKLAVDGDVVHLAQQVPFDVSAPTDDRPFFFQNLNVRNIFDPRIYEESRNANNVMAAVLLIVSMIAVSFFFLYSIRIPLLQTKDRSILKGTTQLFVYFFSIGMAFMMIELSQIQRFSISLGHPIYSISVVLFTLLLGTGIGSMLFEWLLRTVKGRSTIIATTIVAVAAIFGIVAPLVSAACASAYTPARVSAAVLTLLPLGMAMGLGFPLGMQLSFSTKHGAITPWLWGINGAASVCGSVLATLVSLFVGISACYWAGVLFYLLTLISCGKIAKDLGSIPLPSSLAAATNEQSNTE